jgi:hypothetical protein
VHAAAPLVLVKVPGAHGSHVPPLGPKKPGSHVQFVRTPEPRGDDEFCGHRLHSALPSWAKVPGRHAWQTSSDVAFDTAENVPALQLLQSVAFVSVP